MKIVDANGKLILDLPNKPRNFDGWAHGKAYGLVINDERIKVGTAADLEQGAYRLTQLRRAYLDGADTFTVMEATK